MIRRQLLRFLALVATLREAPAANRHVLVVNNVHIQDDGIWVETGGGNLQRVCDIPEWLRYS